MSRDEVIRKATALSNGMMHHLDMEKLWEWASECESVAEVGVWKGATTIVLADACKGPVYAVDWFRGADDPYDLQTYQCKRDEVAAAFMRNTEGYPNIVLLVCESHLGPQHLRHPVDMCFIDANHDEPYVRRDVEAWLPFTNRIISGHDAQYESVQLGVKAILGEEPFMRPGALWMQRLVCRDNRP